MSDETYEALQELRKFMFANVYVNSDAKREEGKAERMLSQLFSYYSNHIEEMPEEYTRMIWERARAYRRLSAIISQG